GHPGPSHLWQRPYGVLSWGDGGHFAEVRMPFDIARIRGLMPAVGDGWVHLEGAAGMLVPEQVASAVATAMRAPVSSPGGVFPASQRADSIVAAARRAIADLTGADPEGVVLGPS